jgi:DNA-binding response OmpR family regulator
MYRILIVDDDHDFSRALALKFAKAGFETITAADAYQAVQEVHHEKLDAMILDIMLPAGGGLHVLKNLRSMPHGLPLPVVVVSGCKDDEKKQKLMEEGIAAFIEKPCDYGLIVETVRKIIAGEQNGN